MKQRVIIALLTVLVLAAGYTTGVWTERHRCKVPPPPPPLLGELSRPKETGAPTAAAKPAPTPRAPNVTALAAEIEKLRPQIDEFRAKLDAIDHEMDQRIDAMLRPDQRELFADLVRRGEKSRAKEDALRGVTAPLTADEIRDLQQRPLQRLLGIVVVPIRLEWNTKQLKLDGAQREQLAQVLKWRREKFIELIDAYPPPSLTLHKLAPLAQRLVQPPEATETPKQN